MKLNMSSIDTAGNRAVVVVLGSWLLLSCAQTSSTPEASDNYHTQISYLPVSAAAQLQQVQAGQSLTLPQSPWGADTELLITERYFSAAGRECASALVHAVKPSLPVILCRYEAQRWGVTRALTQR